MSSAPTSKLQPTNTSDPDPAQTAKAPTASAGPATLEEDDEFEDFPVEDWTQEDTEVQNASGTTHLWEESWDDDAGEGEEFGKQLREELKKVAGESGK